jgi:AcrR family transcriptional regulator
MDAVTEKEKQCRPLRADAARNRERILQAARQVFAERGLNATLDDVATRAGVGVGTVYRRFPNKEVLAEALFEQAVNGIVDLAVQAGSVADSWEALVWFLERSCQRQVEDAGLRDVLIGGKCGHDRVAVARDRIVPAVTRLVERAQMDGKLRPDVVASDVPVIQKMVMAVATMAGTTAPDMWRRYLAMVLDGLAASDCGRRALPEAPSGQLLEELLQMSNSPSR